MVVRERRRDLFQRGEGLGLIGEEERLFELEDADEVGEVEGECVGVVLGFDVGDGEGGGLGGGH